MHGNNYLVLVWFINVQFIQSDIQLQLTNNNNNQAKCPNYLPNDPDHPCHCLHSGQGKVYLNT